MTTRITVRARTQAPVDQAWACFTDPDTIVRWNFATDDWSCPSATSDLHPGGRFSYRMAARDGSMALDYAGTWEVVEAPTRLVQRLDDGRAVEVTFTQHGDDTLVEEHFDPDASAPRDMQEAGWQLILDRFARVAGGASDAA